MNLLGDNWFELGGGTQNQRDVVVETNANWDLTWRSSAAFTRIFSLRRDSISIKLKFASGDLGEPTQNMGKQANESEQCC